mgnify:FL=1
MNKIKAITTGMMLTLSTVWASAQNLKVWAESMTLTANGSSVAYMKVNMTDTDEVYSGFQMAIEVPQGIHIAQKASGRKLVNDASLDPYRFEGLNHTLSVNMPTETLIKLGCIDLTGNQDFYRDDADHNIVEHLLSIGLTADKSMKDGDYVLKFSDCKMIHGDATYNEVPDFTATLTIVGGVPSSIKATRQKENGTEDTYDLAGRKIKKPTHKQVYVRKGKKIAR